MKEFKPIVSVVIPTYNRYKYLRDCVKTILSINSEDIEIVIQDNTENNEEFLEFIENLKDKRIRYFHYKDHVSVIENCDMGVSHANGEYVCMIGDDDTVCNQIIKAARFLKDNKIEGCCFPFPGFYWPDMESTYMGEKVPNYYLRHKATGEYFFIDTKEQIKEFACKGILGDMMPRVYHALVSKNCLNRIYKKAGSFFPGTSPDMSNAVAVGLEIKNAIYLSDYLLVSGYGTASCRGQSNRGGHFCRIEERASLPKNAKENWDSNNPPFFSAETTFAQSVIQALKTMGANHKEYKYDYSGLYASFFWQHKTTRAFLIKFVLRSPKRLLWFVKGVFMKIIERILRNRLPVKNYLEKDSVETLIDAKRITEQLTGDIEYKIFKNNER